MFFDLIREQGTAGSYLAQKWNISGLNFGGVSFCSSPLNIHLFYISLFPSCDGAGNSIVTSKQHQQKQLRKVRVYATSAAADSIIGLKRGKKRDNSISCSKVLSSYATIFLRKGKYSP